MIGLAFLQNLWVRDPARVQAAITKRGEECRLELIKQILFGGCLTGRRIKAAFGGLMDQIIWEEASREIASDSRTVCRPDIGHIRVTLKLHQPLVVITFGAVAGKAVAPLWEGTLISVPHPAAVQLGIEAKLLQAATEVKEIIKERAQGILAKDDPTAAAFNAGYDDHPSDWNPFEPDTRFWRFYNHGWQMARQHAEEEVAE